MSADPEASLQPTPGEPEGKSIASRLGVAGMVLAAVALVAYFALGMPGMAGMDDTATSSPSGDMGDMGGMGGMGDMGDMSGMAMNGQSVDAADFEARMAASDAVVINVHVPDQGAIDGTDLSIPFDQIVDDPRLPTDKDVPILLYCKTGRMSQEAADALVAAGYSDVVQLAGGMDAWQASGRALVAK